MPSRHDIKQDHSPLADIEGAEEHLNLFDFEECRDPLPLGALAHPLNWVAIEQLMAQTVIEEDAHQVRVELANSRTNGDCDGFPS